MSVNSASLNLPGLLSTSSCRLTQHGVGDVPDQRYGCLRIYRLAQPSIGEHVHHLVLSRQTNLAGALNLVRHAVTLLPGFVAIRVNRRRFRARIHFRGLLWLNSPLSGEIHTS